MDIQITTQNKYTMTKEEIIEGDVTLLKLHFEFAEKKSPEELTINLIASDCHYYSTYTPVFYAEHSMRPEWSPFGFDSTICVNMPVYALLGKDGDCLWSVALSDVKSPCSLSCGYIEHNNLVRARIKLFAGVCPHMDCYDVTIRLDTQKSNVYDAGQRIVKWWTSLGYGNDYITDDAFEPVYSTWYAFHHKLKDEVLLDECRRASELGMKTIIVDDGWQCDKAIGYAYCGEWKVQESKFKDLAKFVSDVHSLGMKVVLWYAVPFIGYNTEISKRFEGKYLYKNDRLITNVLDPRYKEVRDYLVGTYSDAIRKYDLDGFKLDFIDSFFFQSPFTYNEEMDVYSLEDAVEVLLSEVRENVLSYKKDALIEFRQRYYGPVIGKYANMLRVADCPGDTLTIINESVRMRTFSAGAAIHSDMLTCHPDEPVDRFLSQFLAAFFCVPQFSYVLSELGEEKTRALGYYIDFHNKHRNTLLKGRLRAYSPDKHITKIDALGEGEIVSVLYNDSVVRLGESDSHFAINSTGKRGIITVGGDKDHSYKLYDLFGNVYSEGIIEKGSIKELALSNSEIAEFCAI